MFDEYRKTVIKSFPKEEAKRYQESVDIANLPGLEIRKEAYDVNGNTLEDHYSLHYSGKEYLDDFWNHLLGLKEVKKKTRKKASAKKTTTRKKTASKKKTTARKSTKKKTTAKRTTRKKKVVKEREFNEDLLEF